MTFSTAPSVVVVAGPNGAGKTTAAPFLLRDSFGIQEFVNADPIAAGLSAFAPESVAIAAGRVMLARIEELARRRLSFGFETTLASRSFAPWLQRRVADGYSVHLVFLWLASPELAIARVARRVELGGHAVPEEVVRRRYAAGLRNFFGCISRLSRRGGCTTLANFLTRDLSPGVRATPVKSLRRISGPALCENGRELDD